MASSAPSESGAATVTLVTQTRVLPDESGSFTRWAQRMGAIIAQSPGFLEQTVIPPSPPAQTDWVVLQRFANVEDARAWLQSHERQDLLLAVQAALVGSIDVHLVHKNEAQSPAAPVSVLISTRVKPGQDAAFLRWQKQIAAEQARFEGFQGYKIEPPIPGVQDHWLMAVRFDSDAHLDAWLNSKERRQLLDQTAAFDERTHVRKVGSGFESWFAKGAADQQQPASWQENAKQNAIVLLTLYPFIFLFDALVQRPVLQARGMPFWLALFVADLISVPLLGYLLVPQANRLFRWWLKPSANSTRMLSWTGTAVVVVLCGAMLVVFGRIP